uniref:Uncharacterized protein n=1 Tax=Leersia perrieri TaxID=77586 RepID=A0A0D9WW03_9ORYZ
MEKGAAPARGGGAGTGDGDGDEEEEEASGGFPTVSDAFSTESAASALLEGALHPVTNLAAAIDLTGAEESCSSKVQKVGGGSAAEGVHDDLEHAAEIEADQSRAEDGAGHVDVVPTGDNDSTAAGVHDLEHATDIEAGQSLAAGGAGRLDVVPTGEINSTAAGADTLNNTDDIAADGPGRVNDDSAGVNPTFLPVTESSTAAGATVADDITDISEPIDIKPGDTSAVVGTHGDDHTSACTNKAPVGVKENVHHGSNHEKESSVGDGPSSLANATHSVAVNDVQERQALPAVREAEELRRERDRLQNWEDELRVREEKGLQHREERLHEWENVLRAREEVEMQKWGERLLERDQANNLREEKMREIEQALMKRSEAMANGVRDYVILNIKEDLSTPLLNHLRKKEDNIWQKRHILLSISLLTPLALLFSIRPLIPIEYDYYVLTAFAVVWGIGSLALPFGLFGANVNEKRFSRLINRLSFIGFTALVFYTVYLDMTKVRGYSVAPPSSPSTISTHNDLVWTILYWVLCSLVILGHLYSWYTAWPSDSDKDVE